MTARHRLTDVETVHKEGAWLCTVRNHRSEDVEIVLVPCEPDPATPTVRAWVNRCPHEAERIYRDDVGIVERDGGIVCPKHGSIFDRCSGECDNGPAADSTLPAIDIAVEDGQVYLTDADVTYLYEGPRRADDGQPDDDMPESTSHLRF